MGFRFELNKILISIKLSQEIVNFYKMDQG